MKVGLLWFDNDPKQNLTAKITQAAKRYHQKFNTVPNVCHVHKSALNDLSAGAQAGNGKTAKIGQIQVTVSPSMLQHHFWIGQEED